MRLLMCWIRWMYQRMGLKEVKQEMRLEALTLHGCISAYFESQKFKSWLGAQLCRLRFLRFSAFCGGKSLDVTSIGKKLPLSKQFQFYPLPISLSLCSSANVSNKQTNWLTNWISGALPFLRRQWPFI
jgi:hypothetical protein